MDINEQLKRIKELMETDKDIQLAESGAVRALTAIRGLVPSIKTMAFISGENPNGKEASPEYNKKATSDLKKILSDGQWGYQPMTGKYGTEENSFLVRNIRKDDLLRIGAQFKQETVIFGERFEDDQYTGMTFQMLYSNPERFGEVAGEMKVYVSRDNAKDFFSKIKGRKFMIPFYGVEDVYTMPNSGKLTVDTSYEDSKWSGGKPANKKFKVTLPDTLGENKISIPDDVLSELEYLQNKALDTMGSAAYNYRGMIKNLLKKYTN